MTNSGDMMPVPRGLLASLTEASWLSSDEGLFRCLAYKFYCLPVCCPSILLPCPLFPSALLYFPLLILSISTHPPIPLLNVCPSIDLPCFLLHSQPLHLSP